MIVAPRRLMAWLVAGLGVWAMPLAKEHGHGELTATVGVEGWYFSSKPAFQEQFGRADVSAYGELDFFAGWRSGDLGLAVVPFFRIDGQDRERTHFDLREAHVQWVRPSLEVRAGFNKVFWGVTESYHLVDIVNQADLVENIDGEDKLGQPMIQVTCLPDWRWGTFDFFLLPYFRERVLPGERARTRFPIPYAIGDARYESEEGRRHPDLAFRYWVTAGSLDLGVSAFHGTSREPRFLVAANELVPVYDIIQQLGVEAQVTTGNLAVKSEIIVRRTSLGAFFAGVGGGEYTWVGVGASAVDVGLVAEFHADGRSPDDPPVLFDRDLFVGARIAPNDVQDTQVLAGISHALEDDGYFVNIEGSRRVGSDWRLEVEMRLFGGAHGRLPLSALEQDDYVRVGITRYMQ